MARLAILASGSGSNFQAIAEAVKNTDHEVACLICDRKNAYSIKRAELLSIKVYYLPYFKREKSEVEIELHNILLNEKCDLIALAGFMRIFTPFIINKWSNKIINIHPSLLPKHPGSHGISDSFNSNDTELGITIHYVDSGVDTGPIIFQESFTRRNNETLESAEEEIHKLEHKNYPYIVIKKLDSINKTL